MSGWLPDQQRGNDLHAGHPELVPWLERVARRWGARARVAPAGELPRAVDLREWASPVWHQSLLNSCVAFSVLALVEYYERRALGRSFSGSKLFLYKATRDLMGVRGNAGTPIRDALEALVRFGLVPEESWPYVLDRLDEPPPASLYTSARRYVGARYYRLDPPGLDRRRVLDSLRWHLALGLPCAFGVTLSSGAYAQATRTGLLPWPAPGDPVIGGHAMSVIGYDDEREALLVRNSFGVTWGEQGHCWMSYRYVLEGVAADWWNVLAPGWLEPSQT